MPLRLCACAPRKRIDALGVGRAARGQMRSLKLAAQITRRERIVSVLDQFRERAFEDDAAAVLSGAGPQIDDVIGGAHYVGIVLHHQNGIAQIAQLFEDPDQPVPCRGCADRSTARPARSTRPTSRDPRQVASWMRWASPPDNVIESRSSVRYSRPTSFRNLRRWRISTSTFSAIAASSGDKSHGVEEIERLGDVQPHHFAEILPADANPQRFLAQPRASAIRAQRR